MKKSFYLFYLFILLIVFIFNTAYANNKITIFTTIRPLEYLIERVGGTQIDVFSMLREGDNPHTFEPLPSQLARLSNANLYIKLGSGIEFEQIWMNRIKEVNKNMKIINAGINIDLIEMVGHCHNHGHHNTHQEKHHHRDNHEHRKTHQEKHHHRDRHEHRNTHQEKHHHRDSHEHHHTHQEKNLDRDNHEHTEQNKIIVDNEHSHKANQTKHEFHKHHSHETNQTKHEFHKHHSHETNQTKHEFHKHHSHETNQTRHEIHKHRHSHQHHIDFSGKDPHIWLSIENSIIMIENIKNALVKYDKSNADYYKTNAHKIIDELKTLKVETIEHLSKITNRQFMIFHPSLGYFAKEFNLIQIPVEAEGKEPGPRQLRDLIRTAKEKEIKVVFASKNFSKRSAEIIAREIGGKVVLINELKKDYFTNIKTIKDAFK